MNCLGRGGIIVEFGDKTIANIYDYTHVMDAMKVGQVVILRDSQRLALKVIPEGCK